VRSITPPLFLILGGMGEETIAAGLAPGVSFFAFLVGFFLLAVVGARTLKFTCARSMELKWRD
jgi:hypothetical protein